MVNEEKKLKEMASEKFSEEQALLRDMYDRMDPSKIPSLGEVYGKVQTNQNEINRAFYGGIFSI